MNLGHKKSLKIVLLTMGGTLLVTLVVLVSLPVLHKLLLVEVPANSLPAVTATPLPAKAEELPVTVYYEMEANSKKISAVYIEVFRVGSTEVTYFEVPADTKLSLSEELYKSLQTYAPELPQYLKVSNMAENFSTEYGLTGCNRILSEMLGVSLKDYVRADKETMAEWFDLQTKEVTAAQYFTEYAEWLQNSVSSRTAEERWIYFESRQQVKQSIWETAPGSREKDGYLLSQKRSKERLEELILPEKNTEK